MNRLVILGIAVVALLYIFVSSIFVVNEREQAIVMRFGQITDVKTDPGLYFKIPTNFVDTVQIIEDRLLRYDAANMTVQVSDGKFYIVDAYLTYRIADPRLFRSRAQGELRVVEDRVSTRFDAALRQVYGRRAFTEALSEQRPEMMREARDLIRPDMAQLGIEVVDVRIIRTDLDPSVSAETFNRMKAERLAEAALLRARGQEAAQTARAIADRQAVEVLSAARRDAEILRGEGDAERSQIFADAYNRDTDFFDFYRSMQSYRAALGPNGTTMVLSPDSEFFRFFQNQNPDNVTPPPEAATTPIPATPLVEEPPVDSPILSQPAADAVTAPAEAAPTEAAPAETTPATPASAEPAPAAPAQ
ncbi:protease modulator HflC [Devosia sp. Root413D1]|uniref:protease modulator HflC n=1 Tax=Devosia sp. Root413D1 TaxID=1736531 RepID=UPI0006F5121D|nr:protease modulator HflC [Devosia sp. Root413D1]KQW81199.1 protease modulator HflC [Devosia sp. Root413D1]